jgi:hypothetical protein
MTSKKKTTLAIFGAGETGGSTLFKQFRMIQSDYFIEKENTIYRTEIHREIIGHSVKVLIYMSKNNLMTHMDQVNLFFLISEFCETIRQIFLSRFQF